MLERLNPFRRLRAIGLDLGSHSLKWAVLDSGRHEVIQSGSSVIFPERQNLSQIFDGSLWESRVQSALQELPREVNTLRTVVQGKTTAYGYLEFPTLPEEELRVAAQAEAQQSIPFAMDNIQFSYTRVPPLSGNAGAGVFYAAAMLSEVVRLRQFLSRIGRAPQRVEIPALALAREFALNHAPGPGDFHALLHIGYQLTQYVVVRDGFPYYARDFSLGAAHFIQALQASLGCYWIEAERELLSTDFQALSLRGPLNRLLDGLQRTRAHGARQLGGAAVQGIYLSGGGAVSNLAAVLSAHLDLAVTQESWDQVKAEGSPAALYKLAAGLAVG